MLPFLESSGALRKSRWKSWAPVPNRPYGFCGRKATLNYLRAQELCESRGGRPGLPVPNKPCGLFRREAALNLNICNSEVRSCVEVQVAVPNKHYGFCTRRATFNLSIYNSELMSCVKVDLAVLIALMVSI